MKRWLVVLLVLLALLILLSPAIVGRLAENNIEENIEWAESDSPGVSIQTESFDRGWLTSEGRHRVVLDGGQFREMAEEYTASTGNADLPSLIIDTQLEHGPLPVSTMSPGLANAVSTFMIDPGNGVPIEIPGALTSKVGLSGASSSHLLLESGSFDLEDARLEWTGADMVFESDPSTGNVSIDGEISPWTISADDGAAGFSGMTITADQVRSKFGFGVGSVDMTMGSITLKDDSGLFSISEMSLNAESSIDDDRLNANTVFTMDQMTIPAFGAVDFGIDVSLERMDAASSAVIGKAFQDAQSAPDPEAALANLYPEIEAEVETLFTRGFSIRMNKLDVTLPQGVVSAKFSVDVPESDDPNFSWATVLLGMNANIDFRIPGAIYEMAAMMNDQAGSLIAMGILVPDGADYVMDAEYAQGLINVNGVPMPVPIPGL